MKNTFNVGDRVRVINEADTEFGYEGYIVKNNPEEEEIIIELINTLDGRTRDEDIPSEYKSIASNKYMFYDHKNVILVQKGKSKTTTSRSTYSRKAERNDGIVFERDAIGARSLKEITDSISKCKEKIKRDEALLRAHRNLFPKKG